MSGQATGMGSLGNTKSAIASVKERGGISEMETSAIGGTGRKGGAAEGPEVAKHHNIASEFMGRMGGEASTGQSGPDSGFGHTS